MLRVAVSFIAAVLAASAPAQAEPGAISVAEYLAAWDAMDTEAIQQELEQTGELDFDKHPEAKLVTQEIEATALAYRASVEAERKAGRTPASCLPEGEVELTTNELIPHLQSYDPAARQRLTLAQAFAELMSASFPCD